MIYNLVAYLTANLTTIDFIANGLSPDSPQTAIMVSDTGGEPQHWYARTDWAVQVLSRSKSVDTAKQNIDAVYALLKNRFGLTLPEATVGGIVYPAIVGYQISPIQTPGYIGTTEEHLEMFSFNLTITTT